jgi:hypothetical protein
MAFVCGFMTEFAWLFWIYAANRGWPARTAVAAMAIGGFGFLGLEHALARGNAAPLLVLGYGAGSYVAALCKRRWG